MHRSIAHRLIVGLLVCITASAASAAPNYQITIDSEGRIAPGVIADPPGCLGPQSPFTLLVTFTNTGQVAGPLQVATTLGPFWTITPGGCSVSDGICEVLSPSTADWNVAEVSPAESVAALLSLRVDSDTPAGSELCVNLAVVFNNGIPVNLPFCPVAVTNSARQCGLGAPAAGSSGLALLAVVLLMGGVITLRRRSLPVRG